VSLGKFGLRDSESAPNLAQAIYKSMADRLKWWQSVLLTRSNGKAATKVLTNKIYRSFYVTRSMMWVFRSSPYWAYFYTGSPDDDCVPMFWMTLAITDPTTISARSKITTLAIGLGDGFS
jgi:uncharacterized membrane-anchored protein